MTSGKARAAAHLLLSGTLLATASLTLVTAPATAKPLGEAKADAVPVARTGDGSPGKPPARSLDRSPQRMPGELLVRFEPGVSASARASARARVDAKLARKLPVRGLELLKVHGVDAARAALQKRPGVRYAEPNYVYRATATPDDPRFWQQWGLDNTGQVVQGHAGTNDADIDAPEAWDRVTGDPRVTVAVVDTGVAYGHPDLDDNIWSNPGETLDGVDDDGNGYVDDVRGWDWIGSDNDPQDGNGHGTHVAGIIAAEGDNGIGGAGVSWDASILPLRVLDSAGSGTAADMVEAVAYARGAGADVLNASLGGPESSQALADAIAGAPELLVVVAAGNEGANNETAPTYPCNVDAANLVCVAATDGDDNLAAFSNYGSTAVDLAAPGVHILSTWPPTTIGGSYDGTEYGFESGTSMATPHVSGAAALLFAATPDASAGEVRQALLDGVDPQASLTGKTVTGGRLNVRNALAEFAPVVQHTASAASVAETGGRVTLTVERRGAADVPVTVDFATVDGSATAGSDYEATSGTLSFAAGQTRARITVPVTDDASFEGDETFRVALSDPTGGAVLGTRKRATVTIVDDDLAELAFTRTHQRVNEGVRQVELDVVRSGALAVPVTVDYAAVSGMATAGRDYTLEPGTLSFAAGQTTRTITVTVRNDRATEGAETIGVSLSRPSAAGAVRSPGTSEVRIAASDQRPDALISKLKRRGYVGNNVYNVTGRHQTRVTTAPRRRSRTFFVRISNDGNVRNHFVVKGTGTKPGARVRYFSGANDITRAMRSSHGWRVRLAPHRYRLVRVRVTVLRRAGVGTRKPFKVRGIWFGDGRRVDTVKGVVRVVR